MLDNNALFGTQNHIVGCGRHSEEDAAIWKVSEEFANEPVGRSCRAYRRGWGRWVASNGSDFAATLLQSDGRKFGFLAKGENTLPAAYYRNRKCKRLCLCCMIRC